MVWLYQGINTELESTSDPKPLPSVTIVVSLKNESKNVVSLIHGLKEIDYPLEKLELILIDDNSTDDTYSILQRYSNEKVHVVKNKGKTLTISQTDRIDLLVNTIKAESSDLALKKLTSPSGFLFGPIGLTLC